MVDSQPDASLQLDQQLCFALYAASRQVTQSYQPYLARLQLTYPQYLAMLALWEQDGVTVKQLGERLLLDSGTLTPLLKRLEGQGRLIRQRDPHDERQVRIVLSAGGRQLQSAAHAMRQQMVCDYADVLAGSAGLRDTLQHLLQLLRQRA